MKNNKMVTDLFFPPTSERVSSKSLQESIESVLTVGPGPVCALGDVGVPSLSKAPLHFAPKYHFFRTVASVASRVSTIFCSFA